MAEDLSEKLKKIDPAVLIDVVRKDQNDPTFEITEWNVKRLSDKGIAFPDGLWLFNGKGKSHDTSSSWSIVLKIIPRPQEESSAKNQWAYWKREYLFAQSSMSNHFPPALRAPRIFRTEEVSDGCWIWMEYLTGSQPAWTLDDYAFAAHQLGLWNGSYLTGASLPSENWFAWQHYRSWLNGTDMKQDIQAPLNQKHLSKQTLTRYEQLWDERETFINALENLPQVFSHFDSQRRNLAIYDDKTGQKELILLDWGQCGVGAVGAELTWLTGFSAALLEWPPSEMARLDEINFPAYVRGLEESGWTGNVDLVRLGFTAMIAVYIGCAILGLSAWWCAPENSQFALQQFNYSEEELFLKWLPIFDQVLKYADEARNLMKKLGYS